jgi:iron complex transport system ATP-binding protein
MSAVLEANAVTARIGPKTLVDRISLSFEPGEAVALVGPNGAGKTTLLRLLSGALRPSEGSVSLKGRALAAYRPHELAAQRAVLSQSITIAFPFTVDETVRMGAGDRSGRQVDKLVDAALAEVGLADLRERIVTTLSGGEQQRVHFARVLVQVAAGEAEHGPGVLLLDEPTTSLDLRHQIDLLMYARRCAARGTAAVRRADRGDESGAHRSRRQARRNDHVGNRRPRVRRDRRGRQPAGAVDAVRAAAGDSAVNPAGIRQRPLAAISIRHPIERTRVPT